MRKSGMFCPYCCSWENNFKKTELEIDDSPGRKATFWCGNHGLISGAPLSEGEFQGQVKQIKKHRRCRACGKERT